MSFEASMCAVAEAILELLHHNQRGLPLEN